MRKLKITICLILSAVLLLGVLPLQAFAADLIAEAGFIGYATPKAGKTVAQTPAPVLPEDANYHIYYSGWICETYGDYMDEDDVFNDGEYYSYCMMLSANDGYTFSDDTVATVNGSTALVDPDASGYAEYDGYFFVNTYPEMPAENDEILITSAGLIGYVRPELGKTVAETPEPAIPSGANYSASWPGWYCDTDNNSMEDGDVFEAGKYYSYGVTLFANEGYYFSSDTVPTVNGGQDLCDMIASEYDVDYDCFYLWTVSVLPEGDTTEFITSVSITGYTRPIIGQSRDDADLPVISDGSAPYSITAYSWYCDSDGSAMSADDVFDANKLYSLNVKFEVNGDLLFGSSVYATVNGGTDLVDSSYGGTQSGGTVFSLWLLPDYPTSGELDPLIKMINVLNFKKPLAGQTPSGLIPQLSAPGGARYSVIGGNWYNVSDQGEFRQVPSLEPFEAGEKYVLVVYVSADEGCYFDGSTAILIDGSASLIDFSATEIEASESTVGMDYRIQTVPFIAVQAVTEISITGYQTPVIGQTVADNLANITFSDNCAVRSYGWTSDTTGGALSDGDVVAEGEEYYMYFNLDAADGCVFDMDNVPAITINHSSYLIDDYYTHYNNDRLVYFTINVEPKANDGKQTIREVNITGFAKPTAGQTLADIKAALAVPDGAPYTIAEVACYSYAAENYMADEDVFEAGNSYYFYFMIAPNDGYEFDEDAGFPTSYLSGERDLIDDNWSDYYGNGEGLAAFGFGTFDFTVEEAAADIKYGDVNGDGKIDGKDLIRLRRYLVGLEAELFPGADCNGDGEVNGKDLIKLRKYLLTEDPSVLGPQ